jgi:hypothetical protein
MRKYYKKHLVQINGKFVPVKEWMRNNPQFFANNINVPTSEQIGAVLRQQGFVRTDSETEVIYRR